MTLHRKRRRKLKGKVSDTGSSLRCGVAADERRRGVELSTEEEGQDCGGVTLLDACMHSHKREFW